MDRLPDKFPSGFRVLLVSDNTTCLECLMNKLQDDFKYEGRRSSFNNGVSEVNQHERSDYMYQPPSNNAAASQIEGSSGRRSDLGSADTATAASASTKLQKYRMRMEKERESLKLPNVHSGLISSLSQGQWADLPNESNPPSAMLLTMIISVLRTLQLVRKATTTLRSTKKWILFPQH
ncbi:hypothetical protein CRG98_024106 [Punica granatum]|uniref:Uncharacterized protein n=1 Tax=Punica granatum TaxID=22663 RepID=A0A2I0JGW1_PUNGR|nr:hypothetical protein CRG98_024106 [Punica granatum]